LKKCTISAIIALTTIILLPGFFSGEILIRLVGFTCSVGVMIIVIPFPQWGKSSNRNDVRYGCLDGLSGHSARPRIFALSGISNSYHTNFHNWCKLEEINMLGLNSRDGHYDHPECEG
ncbi:TPA: hypothetical protein ACHKPG_000595, partial [Escherichia coli]